jgi:integrase
MDAMISAGTAAGRRTPNPSRLRVTDQRVYTILPAGTYQKLLDCFQENLLLHPQPLADTIQPSISAWCRFVFSLITLGGQAGPDAWREILSLRYRHIADAEAGYIHIPRMGGEVPVYIPPLLRLCALSLCRHLLREHGTVGNLGCYPPDGFILPGRKNPSAAFCDNEPQEWKGTFAAWLSRFSTSCGVRITLGQLQALSRAELAENYSPSIAGCLMGLQASNPAPVSQFDAMREYRTPFEMQDLHSTPASINHPITRSHGRKNPLPGGKACPPVIPSRDFDRHIARIRRIVIRFSRAEKRLARARRMVVHERLERECHRLSQSIGKRERESWRKYSERTADSLLHAPDTVDMNMAILIEWLSRLISTRLPNTVDAYLNDVARFLRLVPFLPVFSLSEATIARTLDAIPLKARSRGRLVNTLRMLSVFIRDELGIQTPPVAWWRFRAVSTIWTQPVLVQSDLGRILAQIWKENRNSLSKVCTVLIGYYFGLRVSELCRLELGDVWLDGTPTVFVWDSKRGSYRNVEVEDIPKDVLTCLREYHRQRRTSTREDPNATFLVQENSKPFSRRQVIRFLGRAMDRAGINLAAEGKRLVAHCLRHACANRWWSQEVPLVEIARRLGHKSVDTTMHNYLHTAPYRQEEQMPKDPSCLGEVTSMKALGGILGLTARGARYWIRRMVEKGMLPRPGIASSGSGGISIDDLLRCIHEDIRQAAVDQRG